MGLHPQHFARQLSTSTQQEHPKWALLFSNETAPPTLHFSALHQVPSGRKNAVSLP